MSPRLAASEWTAIKQENFRSYLRAYSAIAAAIQPKATPVGRDSNAGRKRDTITKLQRRFGLKHPFRFTRWFQP